MTLSQNSLFIRQVPRWRKPPILFGGRGVRNSVFGLHHRRSHFYRRVRGLGSVERMSPLSLLCGRHSYLSAVANLPHRGYRGRWGISRTDEEAGDLR